MMRGGGILGLGVIALALAYCTVHDNQLRWDRERYCIELGVDQSFWADKCQIKSDAK